MSAKEFSEAMGEIDNKYIDEAIHYKKKAGKKAPNKVWVKLGAVAACLALALAVGNILVHFYGNMAISAHAYGTDDKITTSGIVMSSGSITDNGEMKGQPLMFYLSGKDIETVRFSCKNQQINFMDWTEKRDEYGNAQNFTVAYGEDESEYYYLTIAWFPDTIIRELTDHAETIIAALPAEMREDIIVMEITFLNGKTATKAVSITLLEDGTFLASFGDYEITEEDRFVERTDSESIPRDILYEQGAPLSIFNELAGLEYRQYTCDGLPEYSLTADDGTIYYLNFSEKWVWRGKEEQAELPDGIISWLEANRDAVSMENLIEDMHPITVWTEEQIEAAKKAALAYYEGTVFSVNSIVYTEEKLSYGDIESSCNFIVNVSKGGVVQEPDRTIALQLENGIWKVVNEGY